MPDDTPPELLMALNELATMNEALYKHLKSHGCKCRSVFDDPPGEATK